MPFKKGKSGNPNGRPKKNNNIADNFRTNPKCTKVLEQILIIAATLGTKNEHKDAMQCAKIVADKVIPTLKAQEIDINRNNDDIGILILPVKKMQGENVDKNTLETESRTTNGSINKK